MKKNNPESKSMVPVEQEYRGPNSKQTAFPNFDFDAVYHAGMTKTEYATVHFIAAHLQAHGSYPLPNQSLALAELAVYIFDTAIPIALGWGKHEQDELLDPEKMLNKL